jgi:hypothetical protein
MLSYDGMIVAPFIVWIVGIVFGRKHVIKSAWILLLTLGYVWARHAVHALVPSGDYAVNFQKLPFNVVGNMFGYIGAIVAGPKVVEWSEVFRGMMRINMKMSLIGTAFAVIACATLVFCLRRKFSHYIPTLSWALCGCISLVAYLGLGGIAERYVLIASGFFLLALASWIDTWVGRGMTVPVRVIIAILTTVCIIWNISETHRVAGDWEKAFSISQNTLLRLKQEFFPLTMKGTFVFVNTPIRYGRAWIFPTGMNDALWHLFRGSDYVVGVSPTVESAFNYPVNLGALYVLDFDGYTVKRVVKEVQTVAE